MSSPAGPLARSSVITRPDGPPLSQITPRLLPDRLAIARLLNLAAALLISASLAIPVSAADPTSPEQQLQILEGRYNSEQARLWAEAAKAKDEDCLLYTSPSPRDS